MIIEIKIFGKKLLMIVCSTKGAIQVEKTKKASRLTRFGGLVGIRTLLILNGLQA
ncbi:hypothetical protein [Flectobacillus roseus]|uniref:hypothetical protein n=1 Tax=Flectobacillus roseus TaxID=502259 RepID=UPI0024B7A7E6|nr:hypothetical protein [Flectobacillus roseus]MDI9872553.1 hypothetical protein [Flectobacillus roseus]